MTNISTKTFDRSKAFTFYGEWAEMANEICNDYGKEVVADFFIAITNYALYEIEPEGKKAPLKYFWPQLKEKIDASQEHRSKGFSKEDKALTNSIIKYITENPDASYREVASAVGCSLGKVSKVRKAMSSTSTSTSTSSSTFTPTSTSTTANMNVREHRERCSLTFGNREQDVPSFLDEEDF